MCSVNWKEREIKHHRARKKFRAPVEIQRLLCNFKRNLLTEDNMNSCF